MFKKRDKPVTPNPEDLRRMGIDLLEQMEALLDTMDGYKAKLLERGYSESAVEAMVVDFHHTMLRGNNGSS